MTFYSNANDVINTTGIRKEDLGFSSDEFMTAWIEARLVEIKDLIDRDRNRDFTAEVAESGDSVPPGIHRIALSMMSNLVGHAILRRTTPIVRIDDISVKVVEDSLFTNAIKKDLKRFPAKINGIVGNLGIQVVKRRT